MVFNSLHFVWFFLVVYALYRVLPHRAQNWLLLAASYYFYAAWDRVACDAIVAAEGRRGAAPQRVDDLRTDPSGASARPSQPSKTSSMCTTTRSDVPRPLRLPASSCPIRRGRRCTTAERRPASGASAATRKCLGRAKRRGKCRRTAQDRSGDVGGGGHCTVVGSIGWGCGGGSARAAAGPGRRSER